jgi:hypothetical protein
MYRKLSSVAETAGILTKQISGETKLDEHIEVRVYVFMYVFTCIHVFLYAYIYIYIDMRIYI